MDENSSALMGLRDAGRRATALYHDGSFSWDESIESWKHSLYNGFEIWWLAGMPIVMVFLFTLLSMSVLSGFERDKWPFRSVLSMDCGNSYMSMVMPFVRALQRWALLPAWHCAASSSSMNGSVKLKTPRHIAVIMDGNRRYGKAKYGSGVRGHHDGSKTLVAFTDWCIEAGVEALTVYAFSTENWNRAPVEVDALMNLFNEFMNQIVPEALKRDIRIRCLVSNGDKFPAHIAEAITTIQEATKHCNAFSLNICVSYGARDEITGACRRIATQVLNGTLDVTAINEDTLSNNMLTAGIPDPDVLLRTSGEVRLSNFLLYQVAYAELIFVDKMWPEMTRDDLHAVIVEFNRRKRRFGK